MFDWQAAHAALGIGRYDNVVTTSRVPDLHIRLPGAGKGTQAAMLEKELGLKQVSSGDLFRENLKNQTELGRGQKLYGPGQSGAG